MSDVHGVLAWCDEWLPVLREHGVPGAAWAVSHGGEVVDGAAGLLSTATGVEATVDSVFQIGSVTKLWTSTLVMQLADEGVVDLDQPVRASLPEFRIADEDAAARITVRQLLNHTAGFEGDIFTDTGPGDDCLEKYVATLHEVPQLFAPGEQFSYNNAGYCVLGRLVEVLRGLNYDACPREHLVKPLGLTHTAPSPYEAIMFRAAVGHIGQEPAPVWALARSNAPAGSTLAMRARDLVTFARMHLEDGTAADGTWVLAPGTSARMRDREVDLPELGLMGTSWGLGFERFDTPAGTIVGHDGSTIGQGAFLRMVPEAGLAVALLTNGGDVVSLYRDVVGHVLGELTELALPSLPVPPPDPRRIDATRYVGTYSAEVYDLTVSQDDDGRIWLGQTPKGVFVEMGGQVERTELVHYRDDMLIPVEAANALLDEAGWTARGGDGTRTKDGTPLALTFLYQNNNGSGGDAAAELAVRQWQAVGVRATARSQNETTLTGTLFGAGDWDVAWASVNINSPDQIVPFLSGPAAPEGTNFAAIADQDYDAAVRTAMTTPGAEGCDEWLAAESDLIAKASIVPFAGSMVRTFGSGAEFATPGQLIPTSIRMLAR